VKEKDIVIKSDNKQIVLYVEKENGAYQPAQSEPFMIANYLDEYWSTINSIEETCRPKVVSGEISPIDYWRQLRLMTLADLASRVNLSAGLVKKHFQPKHFKKVAGPILQRYAEVLGIPVEAFSNITKEYTMTIFRQGKL
jgi:hypothetical protein